MFPYQRHVWSVPFLFDAMFLRFTYHSSLPVWGWRLEISHRHYNWIYLFISLCIYSFVFSCIFPAGPTNVSISGSGVITPGTNGSFLCQAVCYPSCNYTWGIGDDQWFGGQGNEITITSQLLGELKTLTCKATNSVSGLFAEATRFLAPQKNISVVGRFLATKNISVVGRF